MGDIQKYEKRREMVMKTELYSTKTEIIFNGREIKVKADYHIENDGIGSYEYWGAKCFDFGEDYPEIDNIEPICTNESEEEKADIIQFIGDNFELLAEQITDKMMFDQNGYF